MAESMEFKAEVKELLNMVINSIYTNRDIFLRELVANAADAIDKRRFTALTQAELACEGEIRIAADAECGVLSISDNGIGMTKDEMIENLGTIAHSGSKEFLKKLNEAKNAETSGDASLDLIGQFGVGFYSAFMAANRVTVLSKKAGETQAYLWSSEGVENYTVTEDERTEAGTTISLYLKDDFKEYLEFYKISSVIRKYSDFIEYPIKMQHMVPTGSGDDAKEEIHDDTLNTMKAIWLRNEKEVTEEEYKSFYQHLSADYEEPMKRIIFSAEGASEFKALLFFARHLPFRYQYGIQNKKNLSLYVKRVFITDECPDLLPDYMAPFMAGVVDSSDLPLNVSRETLQNNPQVHRIAKAITGRVLKELATMQEKERDQYTTFYNEFGRLLKQGVYGDWENREKLQNLLMFESLKSESGKLITLKEYTDAMPETQKAIYFITGESRETVENSPQLELFKKQGIDVLLMLDPVDEVVMQQLGKYADKEIVSAAKSDLKMDESVEKELKEKTEQAEKDNKNLLEFMKKQLEAKVKDVRFSARLTESACCLVSDAGDPSANIQKLMKAMKQDMPEVKRILELNPDSPLIQAMSKKYEADSNDPILADYAELLFDQALICEGGELPDPVGFVKLTAKLMTDHLQA